MAGESVHGGRSSHCFQDSTMWNRFHMCGRQTRKWKWCWFWCWLSQQLGWTIYLEIACHLNRLFPIMNRMFEHRLRIFVTSVLKYLSTDNCSVSDVKCLIDLELVNWFRMESNAEISKLKSSSLQLSLAGYSTLIARYSIGFDYSYQVGIWLIIQLQNLIG